jgi:predicted nucleic acid-binding protein
MLIVDSSVWVDLFSGRESEQVRTLREFTFEERVAVGDLMICEVLQGVRSPREFERIRYRLFKFEVVSIADPRIAVAAAHNYRSLRQRGITVRCAIDCLIATFCIENGHVLLHNDRGFDPFEKQLGLKVLH